MELNQVMELTGEWITEIEDQMVDEFDDEEWEEIG